MKQRIVLQGESSECGLACLAMISSYHGKIYDMPGMRRQFVTSQRGASAAELIRHASTLELAARALRLELEDLAELKLPCILHWNLNHFVVLTRVLRGARGVIVFDPALGERRLSLAQVSASFTGVALEFTPTPRFEYDDHTTSLSLRSLIGPVRGLRRATLQLLLWSAALELFAVVLPIFNQVVIDEVILSGNRPFLTTLFCAFLLLIAIYTAIDYARSRFLMRWSFEVNLQWVARVFSHLTRLPVAYFEKHHLGDISSRFESITVMQNTLTSLMLETVLDLMLALLSLTVLFVYSGQLALLTLGCMLVYGVMRELMQEPLRNATNDGLLMHARERSYFLETLRSMTAIRLYGQESDRSARWLNLKQDAANCEARRQRIIALAKVLNTAIFSVQALGIFYLGAGLVMDQVMSVGMLMACSMYAMIFSSRATRLINLFADLNVTRLHAERLSGIVHEATEPAQPGPIDLSQARGAITLKQVRFRYSLADPWIVDGVDLHIMAGESVVLTGASGCGKTTLCKILMGLLEPTEGEMLVDGVPVTTLGLANYRKLVGAVMQDDTLQQGSVADNISFFARDAEPERIRECARQAAINSDIMAMPMTYQTLVGETGNVFSGGQKQRILLARALYKQPRILALDEATSHLDNDNERRISRVVRQLRLTRIIVAHRSGAIADGDRLFEVRGGKLYERSPTITGLEPAAS
ncbi:peptidase domain-containing ABC transporter [Janthinobacterium lividum]|uniref:peptidase domain-containing ABC transporter n=1 Tax=Janthinobacterium lividum TaxID=29581 RepID=UPI001409F756|nr:peptidase domain-containing ABC transporter [Janthinobacterium lividum]NHQ92189.1 peptidase domain-containing ABC transporter [Janthinobacterium lividum]